MLHRPGTPAQRLKQEGCSVKPAFLATSCAHLSVSLGQRVRLVDAVLHASELVPTALCKTTRGQPQQPLVFRLRPYADWAALRESTVCPSRDNESGKVRPAQLLCS